MRLDFFDKLKYQSSALILFIGIKYYVRDLLRDLSICLTRKIAI